MEYIPISQALQWYAGIVIFRKFEAEITFMRLNVEIDNFDFAKLGLSGDSISFAQLKEKLNIEYAKDALIKCNEIAELTGLAELTLDEINAEVKAVRDAENI